MKPIKYLLLSLLFINSGFVFSMDNDDSDLGASDSDQQEQNYNQEEINRNNELIAAAENGNIDKVRQLILSGADVNATENNNDREKSALTMAAKNGFTKIVQLLIESGAALEQRYNFLQHDLNEENDETKIGSTPLMLASASNHNDVVELLINAGADINNHDERGFTSLHYAAENQCKKVIEILIKAGAGLNKQTNGYYDLSAGITPFMVSAQTGDIEMVKIFLNSGCDINDIYTNTEDGSNAFDGVVHNGHRPLLEFLFNQPNINVKDNLVSQEVLKHDKEINIIELLLSKGAELHYRNSEGKTPFIIASECGFTEAVEKLIKLGANIKDVTNKGETALHFAAERCNKPIIQLLIKYGADIHAKTNNTDINGSMTPLMNTIVKYYQPTQNFPTFHIQIGNQIIPMVPVQIIPEEDNALTETTKFLLDNGADINGKIKKGQFAGKTIYDLIKKNNNLVVQTLFKDRVGFLKQELYKAINENNFNNFKNCLLKIGSICIKDENGNNLLHYALKYNATQIAKIIYAIRPDLVSQVNDNGETPLSYMVRNPEILEFFKKSCNLPNDDSFEDFLKNCAKQNQNPLIEAARKRNKEFVKKILTYTKIDVNSQDYFKYTALGVASSWGDAEIVKMLLDAGANVNIQDIFRNTAMYWAKYHNLREVIDLLDNYSNKRRKLN